MALADRAEKGKEMSRLHGKGKRMRTYKLWTTKELRELKNGRIPKGRTRRACVMFCRRQGIPFPELAPTRRDENGEPICETCKRFGRCRLDKKHCLEF